MIIWTANKKALGKTSSMQLMSLEYLFNIRPAGFVSKNSNGARKAQVIILSWSFSEELRQTRKKI